MSDKKIGHLGISFLNYPDTSQIHWYQPHRPLKFLFIS